MKISLCTLCGVLPVLNAMVQAVLHRESNVRRAGEPDIVMKKSENAILAEVLMWAVSLQATESFFYVIRAVH